MPATHCRFAVIDQCYPFFSMMSLLKQITEENRKGGIFCAQYVEI